MSAADEAEVSVGADLFAGGDELMSIQVSGVLLLCTALVAIGSAAIIVALLVLVAVSSL